MTDIPQQMKYHKRVTRMENINDYNKYCTENYPLFRRSGFLWKPEIIARPKENGCIEEWIGYKIVLTELQKEMLGRYCNCALHQMFVLNPMRCFVCAHCVGCIESDFASQDNIMKAIQARKRALRRSWTYAGEGSELLMI